VATERLALQSDSLTTQALRLSELLNAALAPVLAVQGLKPATFDLLSTVHAAGPDATQAEIAERLGIKPPSLTEALRGVKDLVEQVPSERDSRAKHLRLTAQGRKSLTATIKSVESISGAIAAGIDKGQLAIAIEVLKKANRLLAQSL
jgi:DNA-binding MarR family transcriptional regulator